MLKNYDEYLNEIFGFGKKNIEVKPETKRKVDEIYKKIEDFYKIKIEDQNGSPISKDFHTTVKYTEFPRLMMNTSIAVINPDLSKLEYVEDYDKLFEEFKIKLKKDLNIDLDKEFNTGGYLHWTEELSKKSIKSILPQLNIFAKKVLIWVFFVEKFFELPKLSS